MPPLLLLVTSSLLVAFPAALALVEPLAEPPAPLGRLARFEQSHQIPPNSPSEQPPHTTLVVHEKSIETREGSCPIAALP